MHNISILTSIKNGVSCFHFHFLWFSLSFVPSLYFRDLQRFLESNLLLMLVSCLLFFPSFSPVQVFHLKRSYVLYLVCSIGPIGA